VVGWIGGFKYPDLLSLFKGVMFPIFFSFNPGGLAQPGLLGNSSQAIHLL
jgi:hypothetical protein